MQKENTVKIILFDGICNLCNGVVSFIIRRDPAAHFLFVPLQSEVGRSLLKQAGITDEQEASVVYLQNGHHYFRSSAILHILKDMGGGWQLLYGFILIPPFIRDTVYRLFARMRYKIKGKRKVCRILSPEIRSRFL